MSTVEDGRDRYYQDHTPIDTASDDLKAKPGSVAWGRVCYRARCGDRDAAKAVRLHANRGNVMAQVALEVAEQGEHGVAGGSEVQADNVTLEGDAA